MTSKRMTNEEICDRRQQHTPAPAGYMQWHDWAKTKSRTHKQVKCSGCGLYTIWVPRAHLGDQNG